MLLVSSFVICVVARDLSPRTACILQLYLRSQFIVCVFLLPHCSAEVFSLPIPPSSHGKYVASICAPLYFCDSALVVATHRVVMETLHA